MAGEFSVKVNIADGANMSNTMNGLTINAPPAKINHKPKTKIVFNRKSPTQTFVGRENLLGDIFRNLSMAAESRDTYVLSYLRVLCGLGGVGKSETVRQFIRLHEKNFQHIIWINAENSVTMTTNFEKLAEDELYIDLENHNGKKKSPGDLVKEVYEAVCTVPSLWVFDNAEDFEDSPLGREYDIEPFLPMSLSNLVKPWILVTSRNQRWDAAVIIPLDVFETEEGLKFLAKTLGKVFPDLLEKQIEEAENLVSLLGGLPLALEEAAAFIDYENTMRVYGSRPEFYLKDYIQLHNKETKRVLTTSKRRHRDNDTPVYITWNITYTKIRAHPGGNLALKLLNYMAYLASEQIPKKLIFHIIQERYEVTESALSLLGKYALMKTDALHFSVHRLVQQVTREHCHDNDEEDEIILYMIERIKLFIDNEPLEAMKDDFIGSVVAFSGYLKRTYQSTVGEKATHFLTSIAIGLHSRGKYASALKIYQQLLEVITSQSEEQQYLQQHKQLFTLVLLNSIGVIYHEMGEPMKAVQTHKDLVSKRTALLGPNHPDTLVSLNNLAAVLRDQGNLTEAISIHQQVAAQNSASMNPNHPNYLATRNNLAAVLRHQGKVQEAYEIMEEVQTQRHLSLGPEHPDSLSASHNIANILFDMGQKRKALDILKGVAEKRERVFGASHPDTLKSKMNVATILEDIGSYEEAHEAHVIVLEGMTAMLGEEHPHILVALGNIALNLERRRLYPEALKTYETILGKQRKLLGSVHRSTLTTLNNVAILYRVMDRLEESLAIHREILEARITNLTEFHPDTLSTKNNIALVLAKLGRLDEAFKIHCEVAENRANLLGEDHADTLGSIVSKANILEEQGKFAASLILHEKVLAARLRKFGSTHPETIKSQNTVEYLSDELAKMNAGNKMANRGGEKKMGVETDKAAKFEAYHPDSKSKGGIWVCLCCGRSKVDEEGPSGFEPVAPKKVHKRVMADEGDVLTLLPSQRNLHLNQANAGPAVTNTGESEDADALFTKSQELKKRNKLTEALAVVEQVIELRKLQLGPRHPDTSAAIEEFTNIMDEQYRAEVKRSK